MTLTFDLEGQHHVCPLVDYEVEDVIKTMLIDQYLDSYDDLNAFVPDLVLHKIYFGLHIQNEQSKTSAL